MAVCKLGSVITVIVGDLEGHTFQRHRGSVVMRTGYHSRGDTYFRYLHIQEIFYEVSQRWRNLSDAQQAQWQSLAEQFPVKDWFGNNKQLTGKQYHQKRTTSKLLVGNDTPIDPFNYDNQVPQIEVTAAQIRVDLERVFVSNNGSGVFTPFFMSVSKTGSNNERPHPESFTYVGRWSPNTAAQELIYDNIVSTVGEINTEFGYWIYCYELTESGISSVPILLNCTVIE